MAGKAIQTKLYPGGVWRYNVPTAFVLKDNGEIWMGHVEVPPTLIWEQVSPPPGLLPANDVIDIEPVPQGIGRFNVPTIIVTTKQGDIFVGAFNGALDLPGIIEWEAVNAVP